MTFSTNYRVINIEDELPEKEGLYVIKVPGGFVDVSYDKHYSFHEELVDCSGVTHWLKPVESSIVLTREEFEKAIGDSYDWGRQREYEEQYMMNANAPDKQQYISSLISSNI